MGHLVRKHTSSLSKVVRMPRAGMSDPEIVRGLTRNDPQAAAVLYDRYGNKVNHLVWRLLGADSEHDDVVHAIFVHILSSIKKLKKPEALPDWITGIAINTVRREIRRRKYRRILHLVPEYPEYGGEALSGDAQVYTQRVFTILSRMKTEDHLVFVLRFIERYTLREIASACGYSLATAKRRVFRSKEEFMKRARRDPILSAIIEEMKDVS
jgi:RNA polymerase sigma-70 factor (ECF subfamily)